MESPVKRRRVTSNEICFSFCSSTQIVAAISAAGKKKQKATEELQAGLKALRVAALDSLAGLG